MFYQENIPIAYDNFICLGVTKIYLVKTMKSVQMLLTRSCIYMQNPYFPEQLQQIKVSNRVTTYSDIGVQHIWWFTNMLYYNFVKLTKIHYDKDCLY